MGTRHARWAIGALLFCTGCQNQDAAQLSKLGAKLGQKLEAVLAKGTAQLSRSWPTLRVANSEIAIEARVAARLRWDKKLADVPLRVIRGDGASVELQGQVEGLEQRRRAVELAENTAGVEMVVDKLQGTE